MNSLIIPPVAEVLSQLFHDAERADRPLIELFTAGDAAARAEKISRLLQEEKTDYRSVYGRMREHYLNISSDLGRFLYMLARACQAKRIVEFGTSFGISTIHLACALRDGGGGHLITTELEPAKAKRAEENLKAAGLAEFVEIRDGEAPESLKDGIEAGVDLVLLDGAISLYLPVLKLVEPHLRCGALVVADNAIEHSQPYLDYIRNPQNGYLSLALRFRDGNELSLRTQ